MASIAHCWSISFLSEGARVQAQVKSIYIIFKLGLSPSQDEYTGEKLAGHLEK
jgi:hypothetical protein